MCVVYTCFCHENTERRRQQQNGCVQCALFMFYYTSISFGVYVFNISICECELILVLYQKFPVNWRRLQRRSYTFCHERLEKNDETMNISQNIDYYDDDDNVHMSIRIKTQHQNFTTQKHIFTSTHSHTHAHSWKFDTIAHMNKTYVYSSRGIHNRSRSSSSRRKIVVIYATACVSECVSEWVCVYTKRESQ